MSWMCQELTAEAYLHSPWNGFGVHARQGWVAIPAWPRHDRQAAGPFVDNVNQGPSLLRLHYCARKKMAELRAKEPIGPNTLLTVAMAVVMAWGSSVGPEQPSNKQPPWLRKPSHDLVWHAVTFVHCVTRGCARRIALRTAQEKARRAASPSLCRNITFWIG